jgi:hypothetical protein
VKAGFVKLLSAGGIVAASLCPALAETPPLPAPGQVFAIAIKPQARQHPDFFTPETLLAALPRMKPAAMMAPIGGKIWVQSGVIVLKDGRVLFWKSYRDDLIAIETAAEPIVYAIAE